MDVRHYIRPDVTVSALVHLSLVAFILIYTEVRPFHPVVEKTVPVDIIVADAKKPDPKPTPIPTPLLSPTPTPSPDFSLLTKPGTAPAPSPAASWPPQPPQQSAPPNRREASGQPQQQAPGLTAPQSSPPSYAPPQPDLTVKYHVMLGLPESIQVSSSSAPAGDKRGEGGDAKAASDNLASSLVDALRQHLKSCSKLPAALSRSDNVAVKLRVAMTDDGRLAAEPALIEGTASLKGVELMRGAIAALTACQPYAMLPADRYGEWKVLDLSFTPHDFNS